MSEHAHLFLTATEIAELERSDRERANARRRQAGDYEAMDLADVIERAMRSNPRGRGEPSPYELIALNKLRTDGGRP